MPFGEVDYNRIAGMKKLFEVANQSIEENAVMQMQVAQEVDHRKRVAVASEIYRQAADIAPKNPYVANNMVRSAAAGLMSSPYEKDQKAGQQFLQIKFDTTPIVQNVETQNVPGYSPTTIVKKGAGTGVVNDISIVHGQKLENPLDETTKLLRMKVLSGQLAKQGLELNGLSLADLADYKEKYLTAFNRRNEIASRYPEADLQKWSGILQKEAPDVLNRLQQATGEMDMDALIQNFIADDKNKNVLSKIDQEKLRAVGQYMQNSAGVKTYGSLIKGYNLEYDPATDTWSKIGAKPAVTAPKKKDYTDIFQ